MRDNEAGRAYFVTGNARKFEEVAAFVPRLRQLDIDLPEIQAIDPKEVIAAKLSAAREFGKGGDARLSSGAALIVEDTSLALECLNGLPGPLIKWFLFSLGVSGLLDLCRRYADFRAEAVTVIGCAFPDGSVEYVAARLTGRIVEPRGDKDFGWGPVFRPDGCEQTFGEMERGVKHALSMRGQAARRLAAILAAHRIG